MTRRRRSRKNTAEAIDKKRYVSELVERVAMLEDEGNDDSAYAEEAIEWNDRISRRERKAEARNSKLLRAKEANEKKKRERDEKKASDESEDTAEAESGDNRWFMRKKTFLDVDLPVWMVLGWIAILVFLMAVAFLMGSLVVLRPRYVIAAAGKAEEYGELFSGDPMFDSFGYRKSVSGSQPSNLLLGRSPILAQTEKTLARSMIVIDRQTGSQILKENPAIQRPIASLTKLMTAYVVVTTWKPEDTFTISVSVNPDVESSAGLPVGETYTRDELLSALLIESAAEAGYTFADTYTGGRLAFVARMNEEAQTLGMVSTSYVDPVGISEFNISSVADLALLTRAVLLQAPLPNIVSASAKEICSLSGVCTTLESTNKLLSDYNYFYGVKTGYTVKAGPCLVAWYRKEEVDFVIVLLYVEGQGTDNRFDIAEELSTLARSATM